MSYNHTSNQNEKSHDDSFSDIVELPLEDILDLHSFPPREIKTLIKDYLQDAYEAGFLEVRIIHGKVYFLNFMVSQEISIVSHFLVHKNWKEVIMAPNP